MEKGTGTEPERFPEGLASIHARSQFPFSTPQNPLLQFPPGTRLGHEGLTDLLVMGRVGVYVDHPVVEEVGTLADATDSALITLWPQVFPYTLVRCITTSTLP